MARFDVYRFPSKSAPLVVDVQSDILGELNSRVVIPLVPVTKAASEELPRLTKDNSGRKELYPDDH